MDLSVVLILLGAACCALAAASASRRRPVGASSARPGLGLAHVALCALVHRLLTHLRGTWS